MKRINKKSVGLAVGLLCWLIASSVCYAVNGYLGIAVVAAGAVVFYVLRHRERKAAEAKAPEGGLYVGLAHGVIYKTELSISECLAHLGEKLDSDPLEFDFGWDEQQKSGSLALYCRKGGLRPSNFPTTLVVSFSDRGEYVWILARYLDPEQKSSVMTRVDIDGFFSAKCSAAAIGMVKA